MLIIIIYLYEAVSLDVIWGLGYCQNTVHVQNMSFWIHYNNAQVCLSVNVSRGGLTSRKQHKFPNAGSMLG